MKQPNGAASRERTLSSRCKEYGSGLSVGSQVAVRLRPTEPQRLVGYPIAGRIAYRRLRPPRDEVGTIPAAGLGLAALLLGALYVGADRLAVPLGQREVLLLGDLFGAARADVDMWHRRLLFR